jgi:hypothetical protein
LEKGKSLEIIEKATSLPRNILANLTQENLLNSLNFKSKSIKNGISSVSSLVSYHRTSEEEERV